MLMTHIAPRNDEEAAESRDRGEQGLVLPSAMLNTWALWLIGGLLTAVISLTLVEWHAYEVRIEGLELFRAEHLTMEAGQAQSLATVIANQQMVLRRLDIVERKLDETQQAIYSRGK